MKISVLTFVLRANLVVAILYVDRAVHPFLRKEAEPDAFPPLAGNEFFGKRILELRIEA